MSTQYLDLSGLQALWQKIKDNFIKAPANATTGQYLRKTSDGYTWEDGTSAHVTISGGGAVGTGTSASTGFAGGDQASASSGCAVGENAKTTASGAAIGNGAFTSTGAAIGSFTMAGQGGAIGRGARTCLKIEVSVSSGDTSVTVTHSSLSNDINQLRVYKTNASVTKYEISSVSSSGSGSNRTVTINFVNAFTENTNINIYEFGTSITNATGGSVGYCAYTTTGGAVGCKTNAVSGGAVGNMASSTSGGAIGAGASATDGFAGGNSAIATANGAVQLGTGTNTSSNTLQYMTYKIADSTGKLYSTGATVSGRDMAELFEWKDKNTNNENRYGYFVTLDENNIRIANDSDNFILGVVSSSDIASFIGNGGEYNWHKKWLTDVYGNYLTEEVTTSAYTDDDGVFHPEKTETRRIINPDYDETLEYIPRLQRPEYAVICLIGQIVVNDDGTCEANHYCTVNENGKATKANNTDNHKYWVMERLDDFHVRILFR